ncbi:MAG: AmmeMemoRadiSam system protein B [Deltaproteobacteria bacterium]|nr:AmmeMemoRadiSam system protein B [Deltaproteobacteria bacterium]
MKCIFHLFFTILLALFPAILFRVGIANANEIRKPAYAGSFYPKTRSELTSMIEQLAGMVTQTPVQHPLHTSLKALIMPHAGYIYSGVTAAHISLVLRENQFRRVIVMAPDHRVGFTGGAISDVAAYETPLGRIPLNKDAAMLRRNTYLFQAIPASDRLEHSVEVVLPFLQYFLKKFQLIPIVLGHESDLADRVSAALDPLIDQNTLLVVSSDLSHYLSYQEAVARDQETIKMILNLDAGKLLTRENAACGRIPILVAINMARRHGWRPILLHYSNSGDTTGDRSRVVGYAAIAFFGGSSMQNHSDSSQPLKPHQGQTLVKLARKTIAERLGKKPITVDPDAMADIAFQDHRGTFVTLTINKQLRGCIGNLDATESILAGIKRNAVNAAFHDPRFPALKANELDRVDIEVSILTQPQRLEYGDSKDLLSKLRVHVDGVILSKGTSSATFLPQVWEQLPRPDQFLSHLCMKAGLPADDWKKSRLDILTYQVQYFEEEK